MVKGEHGAMRLLQGSLRRALMVRLWVKVSCVWLLVLAATSLVLRVAADVPAGVLGLGLTGVGAVLVWSWIASRRGVPDERALLAVLDERGGLGGVLMASGEVDSGGWGGKLVNVPEVEVEWLGRRSVGVLAGCVLLCVACMLAPYQGRLLAARPRLNVDREVEQLAAQLAVLRESGALESERASALEKALEDLRRQAKGDDPVRTWEAIDHLSAAQMQAANQAAQSAIAETEQAAKAEGLARKLAEMKAASAAKGMQSQGGAGAEAGDAGDSADAGEAGIDPGKLAEAMKELAEMAQAAAEANSAIELDAELAEALGRCEMTAEQLQRLADALRQGNMDRAEMMKRLADARLIDGEALKECQGACEGGGEEALAALLGEFGLGDGGGAKVAIGEGGVPQGSGGVGRGGGPTPMTWQAGSAFEGTKFTEARLPVGQVGDIRKSMVLGVSAADGTSEEGGSSAGGALGAGAGSGSGHTQAILPQHRPAVQRYFDRGAGQ